MTCIGLQQNTREDFWLSAPKNLAPKTTYVRRYRNLTAALNTNISGMELNIDDEETALKTTEGPHVVP